MVQLDARTYDPRKGRFLQADQFNFANLALPESTRSELMRYMAYQTDDLLIDPSQQLRYAYASENPLRWIDPMGLRISAGSSQNETKKERRQSLKDARERGRDRDDARQQQQYGPRVSTRYNYLTTPAPRLGPYTNFRSLSSFLNSSPQAKSAYTKALELEQLSKANKKVEYGTTGGLRRDQYKYFYTRTDNLPSNVTLTSWSWGENKRSADEAGDYPLDYFIHTHPSDNGFSDTDKNSANNRNVDSYIIGPKTFGQYDPDTNTETICDRG